MLIFKRPSWSYEGNNGTYYLAGWTTTTYGALAAVSNSNLDALPLNIYNDNSIEWPPDDNRHETPDDGEDDYWNPDPEVNDWTADSTDLTTLGGGRYGKQLVVLGHRKLYFGDL